MFDFFASSAVWCIALLKPHAGGVKLFQCVPNRKCEGNRYSRRIIAFLPVILYRLLFKYEVNLVLRQQHFTSFVVNRP